MIRDQPERKAGHVLYRMLRVARQINNIAK
jgi:hypothetical protein